MKYSKLRQTVQLSRVYTSATCCGQQATCLRQHVARPRNLLPRNMLRWCKRGLQSLTKMTWTCFPRSLSTCTKLVMPFMVGWPSPYTGYPWSASLTLGAKNCFRVPSLSSTGLTSRTRKYCPCRSHERVVVVEEGLTSHQTYYRSYSGRFLRARWPNQQCQSTEGQQLVSPPGKVPIPPDQVKVK